MKVNVVTFSLAVSAVVLTGCQTPDGRPDNTGTGALTGGVIGAASGALIAGPHNAGAGALIGAAAGLIAGGLIGHSIDQQQEAQLRAQAPQTYVRIQQGQPLDIADIKALARAGVSDDVIISQIQASHTAFHLSAADIIDLHASGVSDRVVNFMINSQNMEQDTSVAPAQPATTTVVVQQAPPPPPVEPVIMAPGPGYIWVGGNWVWNGGWVWSPGYWAVPPYPNAVWVRGYWASGPRGWVMVRGHWR